MNYREIAIDTLTIPQLQAELFIKEIRGDKISFRTLPESEEMFEIKPLEITMKSQNDNYFEHSDALYQLLIDHEEDILFINEYIKA